MRLSVFKEAITGFRFSVTIKGKHLEIKSNFAFFGITVKNELIKILELLLILDEYWSEHPELHDVPIYYASSLAKKCMLVYQTYTGLFRFEMFDMLQ